MQYVQGRLGVSSPYLFSCFLFILIPGTFPSSPPPPLPYKHALQNIPNSQRLNQTESTGLQLPPRLPLTHLHHPPGSQRPADSVRLRRRVRAERRPGRANAVLLEQSRDSFPCRRVGECQGAKKIGGRGYGLGCEHGDGDGDGDGDGSSAGAEIEGTDDEEEGMKPWGTGGF